MKRVLAISGGVDSMVLLDFCAKKYYSKNLIVASFDHGTRKSAIDDFNFVKNKAERYGIDFIGKHANLGAHVSEEKARTARYEFLLGLLEGDDILVVAHHLDDLVESISINLIRGTGHKGLAVMNSKNIERPFLSMTKKDILAYAAKNEIEFREDPTNSSDKYLRNKIRFSVRNLSTEKKETILNLRNSQLQIENKIDNLTTEIIKNHSKEIGGGILQMRRDFFYELENEVAFELLRRLLALKNISCTKPQIFNFLDAIRTYQPGKSFNLPKDKLVKINKNYFVL